VANEFTAFLDQAEPEVIVLFNGVLFPEATARWVAQNHGIRVITHEVGFKPFSAFFTDKQATAYPLEIQKDFRLNPEQDRRLDDYLEKRFQGKFTMAGIRFWPEMRGLDATFLQKASKYSQIVPIFTNVIYDTSQVHANTIFSQMFEWLDTIAETIAEHPETLFVVRAHPDELRPGKMSRESVPEWYKQNDYEKLENLVFIGPREYLSSYELIHRSKFVMVYNSSIGLEAALMGKAVLSGGKARYTSFNTVYFPESAQKYKTLAREFLRVEGPVEIPPEFLTNARRLMYFQVFIASIPFDEFLEVHTVPGYVRFKQISWRDLKPENSRAIQTLVNGIVHNKPFLVGNDN
jgi:hypothetical protein